MQKYIKNYLAYNKFDQTDFIPCQKCGKPSADIHHIYWRWWKYKEDPRYLIALCRECHTWIHTNNTLENKEFLENLLQIDIIL